MLSATLQCIADFTFSYDLRPRCECVCMCLRACVDVCMYVCVRVRVCVVCGSMYLQVYVNVCYRISNPPKKIHQYRIEHCHGMQNSHFSPS